MNTNTKDDITNPMGINCCTAFPDGYKDITPMKHENGPDYLKGCKLVHMCLKKGQKDIPHDHPAHYMYILNGGTVKITGAPVGDFTKGEFKVLPLDTGVGMVMPPGCHQVENVGDSDVEVLFLEVGAQSGDTPQNHIGACETDACHYKVLAEDNDWMVVKMDVKAGAMDHAHSHREHVVYALNEAQLSIWGDKDQQGRDMTNERDADMTIPIQRGMVLPVPTGFHIVKNTGETDASCVFFERKR